MGSRTSSRDRIIDAAEQVVVEEGASHMTMDAVAARAGVSKGGFVYHFPSLRHLLQAMLQRFIDQVEARIVHARESLPESPVREVKAYVLSWFGAEGGHRRTACALLATVTRDPELLESVRRKHGEILGRIVERAQDPGRLTILSLATEGMWMSELLGVSPLSRGGRGDVMRALLRFADECCAPAPAAEKPPRLRVETAVSGRIHEGGHGDGKA
jgi:AcrR family transcriptional regulator